MQSVYIHTNLLDLRHILSGLATVSRTFARKDNTERAVQTFPCHTPKLVGVPGNAPGRER
jgi:hypothetical protein